MANNKKLKELIENVQEQIQGHMVSAEHTYCLSIGDNVRWWNTPPLDRAELDEKFRLVYWVLESIKHAANDSEQAPEVDINDNET